MPTIGFFGGGQIARALAGGFLAGGAATRDHLLVVDRYPAAAEAFAQKTGARIAADGAELARAADVIFLCVKPQDVAGALTPELHSAWGGKLLVSVVAGLPLARLVELAGAEAAICRSMPNTAAEVRLSATAVCFTPTCTAEQISLVEKLFGTVGEVFSLPEKLFDAVVGVSGSGPAYACLVIEAMSDGGVAAGLPRETATRLAALAVQGAAALTLQTGVPPAELREKISSPGGTTIAALQVLEAGATRARFSAAVRAAARRSSELAGS
jgi:pyrroline-5-carboxylate reductase